MTPGDRRACSVKGCDRPIEYTARALCRRCYKRVTGKTAGKTKPSTPDVVRFEARLEPGPNGCWNWTGSGSGYNQNYGRINLMGRRSEFAHRWSYEYHRGEIPEGLEIDHLCHNTRCVNPWHLEPVTHAINQQRLRSALSRYCKRGHEFTPENTVVLTSGNGRRTCRTCVRDKNAAWRAQNPRPKPPPAEFCKNGHPMSGDNLVEKSGLRICRECRRAAARISNAKRWGTPANP